MSGHRKDLWSEALMGGGRETPPHQTTIRDKSPQPHGWNELALLPAPSTAPSNCEERLLTWQPQEWLSPPGICHLREAMTTPPCHSHIHQLRSSVPPALPVLGGMGDVLLRNQALGKPPPPKQAAGSLIMALCFLWCGHLGYCHE